MMSCKATQKQFSNYLDDSLTEHEKAKLKQHLDTCKTCYEEVESLRTLLREASELQKAKAPDTLWSKIESELAAPHEHASKSLVVKWGRVTDTIAGLIHIPGPMIKLSGAIAVLAIGIIIGRYMMPSNPASQDVIQPAVNANNFQLASRTTDYIKKSKILFLGMVNADEEDIRTSDWSSERRLAQGLVQEAAFLKENISSSQNARLRQLVDELELILLEIANLEKESDLKDVDLIRSGIDQKGILLKINVHDMTTGKEPPTGKSM